jgi:ribosome maturation factor RimP
MAFLMAMADVNDIARLCEAGLEAVGYELVDLEYRRDGQGWVLRIYIDHPYQAAPEPAAQQEHQGWPRGLEPSTITLEDCKVASRHLGTVLDVEDPIETSYRLEVSSPGVRRPLRKRRDFERFVGHKASIELQRPRSGRRRFKGRITGVDEGEVELELDKGTQRLPLADIKTARLDVEFDNG